MKIRYRNIVIIACALFCIAIVGMARPLPVANKRPELTESQLKKFNDETLKRMETWREKGYEKKWEGHGVTADIKYADEDILLKSKSTKGTFCTSATFQAFCESYQLAVNRTGATDWFGGMPLGDFWRFYYLWALNREKLKNDKELSSKWREGCAGALVWSKAADNVSVDDLERGDYIQFWWSGKEGDQITDNGHSAIVWSVKKNSSGKTERIWYWSSQESNYDPETDATTGKPGYGLARRHVKIGSKDGSGAIFEIHGARLKIE